MRSLRGALCSLCRRAGEKSRMKLLREPLLHFVVVGALLFGGYSWLNNTRADPTGGRAGAHRRRRRALAEADMVEPMAARADGRRAEGSCRRSAQREAHGARGRGDGARRGRHHHPPAPGAKAEIPGRGHRAARRAERGGAQAILCRQRQPVSRRRAGSRSGRSISTRSIARMRPPTPRPRSPG